MTRLLALGSSKQAHALIDMVPVGLWATRK